MRATPGLRAVIVRLALASVVAIAAVAAAETVTLKNGLIYRGAIDKDNTIVSIFDPDGLKRVILRDSKIATTGADPGTAKVEHFPIVQPLTVHAGEMPKEAFAFDVGPWDGSGRRMFAYRNARGPIKMQQAIIDLGPRVCRIRGVDGFWVGQVATSTVPREVVLGILAKVDQKNVSERIKVCRFLIQAEWLAEARTEVERVAKDFAKDADVVEKMNNARDSIREAEGRALLAEIDLRRKAQQPRAVASKLRTFPTEGMPPDVIASVNDQIRKDNTRASADKDLADAVRSAAEAAKVEEKANRVEILEALATAPDAVRDRFEAFERGRAESAKPEELYALALSSWVAGPELATTDGKVAEAMWKARDLARSYLATAEDKTDIRAVALEGLKGLDVGGAPISLPLLTEIVRRMPPPSRDGVDVTAGKPTILRVRDDPNPNQPSEYAAYLPPEYSPLRSYPMIVTLHGAGTPTDAVNWWLAEASRKGYIVIAPEYLLREGVRAYQYTVSEHAAVTLALRDALKRFAVDPDRVFLGGSVMGANMAWDYGQAHPDLFAGVAVVGDEPAKYVWATRSNLERVPFYVAMGDLAPAETDVIFGIFAKPAITRNYDFTYVEYYRRGLEDLPEEAGSIVDWMGTKRRAPPPKDFEVVAARECDNRFYGIVSQEFFPGATKEPAGVDVQAKSITKPATITGKIALTANLVNLTTRGIKKMDVWVGPKQVDFTKKMEIRVNNKTAYKAMPKPEIETFLEDVRTRGDRSQVYWMKVSGQVGGGR